MKPFYVVIALQLIAIAILTMLNGCKPFHRPDSVLTPLAKSFLPGSHNSSIEFKYDCIYLDVCRLEKSVQSIHIDSEDCDCAMSGRTPVIAVPKLAYGTSNVLTFKELYEQAARRSTIIPASRNWSVNTPELKITRSYVRQAVLLR